MKTSALVLCVFITMVGTVALAQETEPQAIFKKVTAAYKSLETYSAEGTTSSDIDTGEMKMKLEVTFSIKLKKPNLYLISWEQKNSLTPTPTQSGAVWNDGTQPFLYMGIADQKTYSRMNSDEMALASATGISNGAASTIPSLFFTTFKEMPAPFSRLVDPKLEGSEQVEGEDCYVISGSSPTSKKETFWISKKDYLIRQYSHSLEAPEGGRNMFKMTDQQVEEAIKAMGQEVTAERKEAMKKMMKQAQDAVSTVNLKGISTELQAKIGTPKLLKEDFAFKLPEGAVFKESFFGEAFNTKEVKKMNFTSTKRTKGKQRSKRR